MTHRSIIPPVEIAWGDCSVIRYETNNGIVLSGPVPGKPFDEVLFYIDGADLGFCRDDHGPEVIERATPLFKVMLQTHNRAVCEGIAKGRKQAKAEFRHWLEGD